MNSYTYNKKHLIKNGKPWFPTMGEIHYSRLKAEEWKASLAKMQAGGIEIASAYVIWIHHEEVEEEFDFSASRNLKDFVQVCKDLGISLILRIGPWVHGEVRNGGFPDWLQSKEKEFPLRSNNERYLAYVRRFWEQVYKQVEGMFLKDGGPIIGVQIENEYGHVGGFRGEEGQEHMRTLQRMAKEIGFDVPLYTATGWGGAVIGDCLPVMGGYCEAPWAQNLNEPPASPNYLFTDKRNDTMIASDHRVGSELTFDMGEYPFLTAELGGGIQVTRHRRPVASGKDIGAMTLAKLGCGAVMLGYYMYHGGTNPEGKLSTLEENKASGSLNDLPIKNYDFNAPLRQYGSISDTYKELKLWTYFVQDYGEMLAPLELNRTTEVRDSADIETLRLAIRSATNHEGEEYGFLFFNNYLRRHVMKSHTTDNVAGVLHSLNLDFPTFSVENQDFGAFPFHLDFSGHTLVHAHATPFCTLHVDGEEYHVFQGDRDPQFVWKDTPAKHIHLTRAEALNTYKINWDQEYLLLAQDAVWLADNTLHIAGGLQTEIKSYPALQSIPKGFVSSGMDGFWTVYRRVIEAQLPGLDIEDMLLEDGKVQYNIRLDYAQANIASLEKMHNSNIIAKIRYVGESLEIYSGDLLLNDHYYTGQEVPIYLRYFDYPNSLRVVITPLSHDTPVFLDQWPKLGEEPVAKLLDFTLDYQFD